MSKPHIRKSSFKSLRGLFACSGEGFTGYGATIPAAYKDWLSGRKNVRPLNRQTFSCKYS